MYGRKYIVQYQRLLYFKQRSLKVKGLLLVEIYNNVEDNEID